MMEQVSNNFSFLKNCEELPVSSKRVFATRTSFENPVLYFKQTCILSMYTGILLYLKHPLFASASCMKFNPATWGRKITSFEIEVYNLSYNSFPDYQ